jgi:hypothetical protein
MPTVAALQRLYNPGCQPKKGHEKEIKNCYLAIAGIAFISFLFQTPQCHTHRGLYYGNSRNIRFAGFHRLPRPTVFPWSLSRIVPVPHGAAPEIFP